MIKELLCATFDIKMMGQQEQIIVDYEILFICGSTMNIISEADYKAICGYHQVKHLQ